MTAKKRKQRMKAKRSILMTLVTINDGEIGHGDAIAWFSFSIPLGNKFGGAHPPSCHVLKTYLIFFIFLPFVCASGWLVSCASVVVVSGFLLFGQEIDAIYGEGTD
jgi:hypothetical protein